MIDDLERIERAFMRLPRRHQQMILLCQVDGLDYVRIAERLGISITQVERRVACAIAALDWALHEPERPRWRLW